MEADIGALPLAGLRVLEFAHVAAGPFAGSLLADLGADVVKMEPPDGDSMRYWPPFVAYGADRISANFAALNRNKRSIAVDLKTAQDAALIAKLCARADVLIENYRPGTLERLGFGYETLSTLNGRLVYCSISGYGQRGPKATTAAFDVAIQAVSGLMSVTGERDRPGVKCGAPIGDFVSGLYAAFTVLALLRRRADTGRGGYIDCSMLGSLLGVSALQTSEFYANGTPPERLGSAHPRNAPYQAFQAYDRSFVLAAGTAKMWRALCVALHRTDLITDPRFKDQESRVRNQGQLAAILDAEFAHRPAAYWIDTLAALGLATAPVNDYAQALGDEQIQALGLVRSVRLGDEQQLPMVTFPIPVEGETPPIRLMPPVLGADREAVLREWADQKSSDERIID